jgi:hypothetical protein
MTTNRVVIGQRASGAMGLFVSPPGVDAMTAPDNQLLLNISDRVSQLLFLGFVGSTQNVSLGVSGRPIVLLWSSANLGGIPGYEGVVGPTRPSPLGYGTVTGVQSANVLVQAGGAYMTIACGARTGYAVYNSPY